MIRVKSHALPPSVPALHRYSQRVVNGRQLIVGQIRFFTDFIVARKKERERKSIVIEIRTLTRANGETVCVRLIWACILREEPPRLRTKLFR